MQRLKLKTLREKIKKLKIKKYFLTGLLATLPIFLTIYITVKIFGYVISVSDLFIPRSYYMINSNNYMVNLLFRFLSYSLSIIFSLASITFIGAIALNYFGKVLINNIEAIIARIPLSRTIYGTVKQISEIFLSKEDAPHKRVVMVEYPNEGLFSIGFMTNEEDKDNFVTVFIPTSPNPTSGFLVMLKREKVRELDISIEDAIKLIISAGAIRPSQLL
ncbi:MAG TPA: hypothetical protein DEP20_02405 [Fusobacteria bacterium]|nr:hypothetical protein [Fusobacteriota bacterium]